MQLPPDIRAAIDTISGQSSLAELRAASAAVSVRYRGKARVNAGIVSDVEARAYLGARFPATYVAAYNAFSQAARQQPQFQPVTLCDIGAGPGTVALAALAVWPGIETIRLIEPNVFLRHAGMELFAALGVEVEWIAQSVQATSLPPSDLVSAGYMMNEIIRAEEIESLAAKLWQATSGALVVIEPGTPEGYAIILRIREQMLKFGAHMVAPCPQQNHCPLAGTTAWCHFSGRIERSKLHRNLKLDAVLSYEDEKFSYVAFGRDAVSMPAHRVIGHPSGTKLVQLQLCNADGTATTAQIPKSHPQHKMARKLEWGDAIDETL